MEGKREVNTSSGVKVNYPEHYTISEAEVAAVDECCTTIENTTGRQVYAVYYNEDRFRPGTIHDIKFVLKKQ